MSKFVKDKLGTKSEDNSDDNEEEEEDEKAKEDKTNGKEDDNAIQTDEPKTSSKKVSFFGKFTRDSDTEKETAVNDEKESPEKSKTSKGLMRGFFSRSKKEEDEEEKDENGIERAEENESELSSEEADPDIVEDTDSGISQQVLRQEYGNELPTFLEYYDRPKDETTNRPTNEGS